jgi:hypothetical protein
VTLPVRERGLAPGWCPAGVWVCSSGRSSAGRAMSPTELTVRVGCRRAVQPADRGAAVHLSVDCPDSPGARVRQAGHLLPPSSLVGGGRLAGSVTPGMVPPSQ